MVSVKTITFTSKSRKDFRKLAPAIQAQLMAKLARYGETGAGDVTQLVGEGAARLRSGDYRAIFVETDTSLDLVAVGHRREVYR